MMSTINNVQADQANQTTGTLFLYLPGVPWLNGSDVDLEHGGSVD